MFRSEDMALYYVSFKRENAVESINKLGEAGLLHFINSNSQEMPHKLPYVTELQKANDLVR
jgi:hypothetical protein